ncbi:MAG TPA: response regulator [Acidobacteriaceae bacterium]
MARILVVDDDEIILLTLTTILNLHDFHVTTASTVAEALRQISSNQFDVLLTDLHMPAVGDGLTVVSAMRHAHPQAVTLLLSAFPAMHAAAHAIVLQADEVLVKPLDAGALVESIQQRLAAGPHRPKPIEGLASFLERSTESVIDDWYGRIQTEEIMAISLTREQRCAHLPQFFREIIQRLETPGDLGAGRTSSDTALKYGTLRRQQGYTPAMLIDESRELQRSIFQTLQENLTGLDFTCLLAGVMTIADEIDSHLTQAMRCYSSEPAEQHLARAS